MQTGQTASLVNRRRKRRAHLQRHPLQSGRRFFLSASASLILFFTAGMLVLASLFAQLTKDLPPVEALPAMLDLEDGQLLKPTRVYDRSGQVVLTTLENPGVTRRFLPLDPYQAESLSPQLVQTVLRLYDPAFWQGVGLAYWDASNPQPLTIAERLVDTLLLEGTPPGLQRTLQMRILAGQAVARYGRSSVLEWYLNSAYFGHLAYGADSAAQLYLGKSASQLNLAEAALLIGVLERPALNPFDAPNAARDQQRSLLGRLYLEGAINEREYQEALEFDLTFQQAPSEPALLMQAFIRLALEQAADSLGARRIERGGLQIITTINSDLQSQLVCSVRNQLERLQDSPEVQDDTPDCPAARLLPTLPPGSDTLPVGLTVSAVVLDVRTGEVLALLGDTSLAGEQSSFSSHPPGSLLSPFVALAGFTRGMSPATLVWDIPSDSLPETPQNPDVTYHGPQRLRVATANNYLAAMTRLLLQVGPETVTRLAESMGLSGLSTGQDPAAMLFEGGAVSPLSVANTYNVFANLGNQPKRWVAGGESTQPAMVLSIKEMNGRLLLPESALSEQAVLGAPLAYLTHSILSDENARWPSLGHPNPLEIGRPAGALVGRTAAPGELWTVGYTPDYMMVVWMGWPKGVESAPLNVRMPAGIWHAFMQYANRNQPAKNWEAPTGVVTLQVCDPSGKLPTTDCPVAVPELFLSGTEPVEGDDLYQKIRVNRETGLLATVFTPLELMEERIYLAVPPDAQEWARAAGVALPPINYDTIQPPFILPDVEIAAPAIFSYVSDQVEIRGTAAGEGFVSYRVQIGEGLNPRNWIQLGDEETKPVQDGVLARWNTRGQEGLYAVQLLVLRGDQRIDSTVIQVTVDNTPPEVHITYPFPGQQFDSADKRPVTFQTQVSDNLGLAKVEWYVDGNKVGDSTQTPYSAAWQTEKGKHVLTLKAFDVAGNTTEALPVKFTVE
ncbi:MAG: penicillin-binding protein [Anaerolineaceae bacterium]|nr:penicillin-binding protein [Anaerolineaceae bacterium]